ncbi:MAG: Trk system potassium transporter TrkA [Clostridia bacterium]|nr:Trk system potassium transporter TrkA [Clostridia bacterium]
MNIIVVGCGKIGTTVVESLVAEGHNVTVVDIRPLPLTNITNIYDVMTVCGNGADCETLAEAGVADAELVVAATGSDEVNMLCCHVAKKMGASNTVARIRKTEFNDKSLVKMKELLDLSLAINPDSLAAQEIYHILRLPAAVKLETFARGNFEMIEIKLKQDSPFVGVPLSQLRDKIKATFLVCVVQRGEEVFIPDGHFVLQDGDRVGVTAKHGELIKLLRGMGTKRKQTRKVMILGGSRTAYYLAKRLLAAGTEVKIIDKDREVCEILCELLPGASVICGDGTQQEVLLEEGLDSMDAFVSLTGLDEQNILLAFFAASHQVSKVIPKVNRRELGALAERLGLDTVVSPRKIVADMLVQHARALENSMGSNVETLYRLMDDGAEALEFNVKDDPRLVNIPLKTLQLKRQVLVAGIIRGREVIIPTGDDVILPRDQVVVITAAGRLNDLSDILK